MTRTSYIKRVAVITLAANLILTALKLVFGAVLSSPAVIADGIHSLSDAATTVVVIIAAAMSGAQADSKHNYGHERIEPVLTKLIALAIFATGAVFLYQSINDLIDGAHYGTDWILIAVTGASVILKEGMYHYTRIAAKKAGSDALRADAVHHRSDALSSVAVLLGIGANIWFGFDYMQQIALIAVAVMLGYSAIKIYLGSVRQLIDTAVDDETLSAIKKLIDETEGVIHIDDLKTRVSGTTVYVDAEISVDPSLPLYEAHRIAETVHMRIETELNVKHCTVHINPDMPNHGV